MASDLAAISGRLKNSLAMKDIAISPAGLILINMYTHVLASLYDFADSPRGADAEELKDLIKSHESFPLSVIQLTTPKGIKQKSLYEEAMEAEIKFGTTKEALAYYIKEYEALGEEYGVTGDELWLRAESTEYLNEDCMKIMRLARSIQMCRHLINKNAADKF